MTILEKLYVTDRQERVLFCRASAKSVFMEKSIVLNAYIGKLERSQINDLCTFTFRN